MQNEMRDRLVELLKSKTAPWEYLLCKSNIEALADYLIENGAIVPPCKVGDTVYVDGNSWSEYACIHYENEFIHSKFFVIGEIVSIVKTKKQLLMKIRVESANHSRYYHKRYTVNAIGKTVFLTKEEAEQALKGHEGK